MRGSVVALGVVLAGALVGCRRADACGPVREGLEVLVEGNVLARGKLSLSRGSRGEALATLVMEAGEGGRGAVLKGRGVCKDRVVAIELEPGAVVQDGSQVIGGQVVLVNGAIDEGRVFGTWEVQLKGPERDRDARGFLGTEGARRLPKNARAAR